MNFAFRRDKLFRAHASALGLCSVVICSTLYPLRQWLRFSKYSLETSDLWLIPLISLFLLVSRRKTLFDAGHLRPSVWALPVVMIGVFVANGFHSGVGDIPTLPTLGIFLALIGCFVACYGWRNSWRARFPLAFVIFAVPIPALMLNWLVSWLQHGSAAVVQTLFWLARIDFVREGMRFDFPTFAIEIASECSGIRSSFALVVLTVLIAETTLNTPWRKLLLVLAVFPLVLVKNGIRIVTLTILAMKVDPSFLDGPLHHRGGFVFFGVALVLEAVLCWILLRSERRSAAKLQCAATVAAKELVATRES